MKYLYSFCLLFLPGLFLSAQEYVHQVIFLNEGWYDFTNDTLAIAPSVGSYDPLTETYTVFDELTDADFASDVLVDDVIYVAADNQLITYDKNSLTRLQTISVPGIRELAVWGDQLLVSRGDYLVFFDSYFQVYDKHTLELLYALDTDHGPAYATEGIVVRDDKAYVAINNGFVFGEEVGFIGVVDLLTQTYTSEIDLGPAGINPDNIMLDDDMIYTLNNKDYLSSSISVVDPVAGTVATHDMIAANSGCGTSTYADDHIYFMEYGVDKLARFDVQTGQVIDTLAQTGAYYGLIDDEINGQLIATWTDFFSQGTAFILNYDGSTVTSFDVGVSPGSIALDVRMVTGIESPGAAGVDIRLSPNPAHDVVTLSGNAPITSFTLYNARGEALAMEHINTMSAEIPVAAFPGGLYLIQVTSADGQMETAKLLVQ